jgi:GT2 family glycosyltransferase
MTRSENVARTPVIILNWNGWEDTFACLRSLAKASDVTLVWLVDNGSDIDRSDEALRLWPGLRLVSLGQNFGFSGGMNRAMRIAAVEGYSFVYLLNNDCTVTPGFLRAARDAAHDSDVAIVGSRVGFAAAPSFLCFDGRYYDQGEKAIVPSSVVGKVSAVDGAGMLVRLAALERNGYFDERFFCYHEEGELCRRLISAGWTCAIADASLILHKGEGSNVFENALYYRVRNGFLLAECVHDLPGIRGKLGAWFAACYQAALIGESALRYQRRNQLSTLAVALVDGVRGRFGQRRLSGNRTAGMALLRVLIALRLTLRWLKCSFGNRVERQGVSRQEKSMNA